MPPSNPAINRQQRFPPAGGPGVPLDYSGLSGADLAAIQPAMDLRPVDPGRQALANAGRRRLIMDALANQGRGGDTMLAHVNPQEMRALMLTGGAGTRNPATGLPQFYGGMSGGAGGGAGGAGDDSSDGASTGDGSGGVSDGGGDTSGTGRGGYQTGGASASDLAAGGSSLGDTGQYGQGGSAGSLGGPAGPTYADAFAAAAPAYQNRGFWERIGEALIPGYEARKPNPTDPSTYTGGTYHTDINPAAVLGGIGGSLLAGPIGGFLGGRLLGAGYNALGGPVIGGGAGPTTLGAPSAGTGPASVTTGGTTSGGSTAPALAAGGGGGGINPAAVIASIGDFLGGGESTASPRQMAAAQGQPRRMGEERTGADRQRAYEMARLGLLMPPYAVS